MTAFGWNALVGHNTFLWQGPNRGLMLAIWWNVALFVLSAAAYPFDRRAILGLNPWIKPIKFELSVILFCLTVAALLSALGRRGQWEHWRQIISWGIGIAMIFENSIIAMQSARGVRSHMNFTSLFNSVAFGIMGFFILVTTILIAGLLVLFLVSHTGLPRPVTLGICLGLAVTLAGCVEGVQMVGHYQAHTVGAPDGGPGLPFLNWSTQHGDLRIAHFLALHALQLFPLIGWLFARAPVSGLLQLAGTIAFATAYSVLATILFVQAVRGHPLLGVLSSSQQKVLTARRR